MSADLAWLEELLAGHPGATAAIERTRELARDPRYAAGLGVVDAELGLDRDLVAYFRGCVELDRRARVDLSADEAELECERLGELLARTGFDTPARRALMVTAVFARVLDVIEARIGAIAPEDSQLVLDQET